MLSFPFLQHAAYLVDLLLALDHAQQRVVEPVFELCVAGKDLGHEEVHQGPQLHQVILQRCACKASLIDLTGRWQQLMEFPFLCIPERNEARLLST